MVEGNETGRREEQDRSDRRMTLVEILDEALRTCRETDGTTQEPPPILPRSQVPPQLWIPSPVVVIYPPPVERRQPSQDTLLSLLAESHRRAQMLDNQQRDRTRGRFNPPNDDKHNAERKDQS